jgi:hypothetical protein
MGPQQSLYLPAPWLQKGANEVVVFDYTDLDFTAIARDGQSDLISEWVVKPREGLNGGTQLSLPMRGRPQD